MVGYFPEGTPYGPQNAAQDAVGLNVQFGSAYISKTRVATAMQEMSKFGEFKNGAFSRKDKDGGTHNQDSFEALWEHVYGQPLQYAKPRYSDPILIQPAHFDWIASSHEPGVSAKMLGVFTERQTEVSSCGSTLARAIAPRAVGRISPCPAQGAPGRTGGPPGPRSISLPRRTRPSRQAHPASFSSSVFPGLSSPVHSMLPAIRLDDQGQRKRGVRPPRHAQDESTASPN